MIVGNGQLARAFKEHDEKDFCIFASGVSNSKCIEISEFTREKELLIKTLIENNNTKIIYFSSCALSAKNYQKNAYYSHKAEMENIIKNKSKSYFIFRLPQLFGNLFEHKTLINYLYFSILKEEEFSIYDNASRYLIEIGDVVQVVLNVVRNVKPRFIMDIANPYAYSIFEIVKTLEKLIGKDANYNIIKKTDKYILNLDNQKRIIKDLNINIDYSPDYLFKKLNRKLK